VGSSAGRRGFLPTDASGRLDVRLPARQWGERITLRFPGGRPAKWSDANHAFTEGEGLIAWIRGKSKAVNAVQHCPGLFFINMM
jgi:hypothetical protein